MVPTYVQSPADLDQLVTFPVTSESLVLEFKEAINVRAPGQAQETCRDIAQLANTDGGCLLIGVQEALDPATNLRRAVGVRPVADPNQLIDWVERAISNYLVPSTFTHTLVPIDHPRGMVVAVNVFPSQHTVFLWDREGNTMEVLRRTSYGKTWMNPDEMERHMMNGTRATRLRMEEVIRLAANRQIELAGGYFNQPPGGVPHEIGTGPVELGLVGDMAFEMRISYEGYVRTVEVPYEVVRSVWLGSTGRIQLMLSVRVLHRQQEFMLIPYNA